MITFWIPTIVLIVVVSALVISKIVRAVFSRYPRVRTSAQERLIALNPTLNAAGVRWSVAAKRIRIGWVTSLAVAIAVLISVGRPIDRTTAS